jgi:acyl transferase domain-containing protein
MPWPNNRPRRISVNSFGVGGTNGHIILDDAYHYLHDRGVKALHNTASAVPSQKEIDKLHAQVVQETTHSSSTSSENEYVHVASQAEAPVGIPGRWDFETEPHSNNDQAHFPIIVPLTAFDEGGVQRLAGDHTEFLKHQLASTTQRGDELLMRYAYTMSTKRTLFNCRGYVVATNMNDLLTKLARPLRVHVKRQNLPDLSFVFTGQGAQWPSMGLSLMVYPVFRQSLEAASKYMQSQDPSLCLLDEIRQDSSRSRIHDSYVSQPACTAVQIALVDLLASWGIRPSRCTGHSSGEIAAAYCAGRISREAAWMIAQCRGRISSKKGGKQGAMLAVGLAAPELLAYMQAVDKRLKGPVSLARNNLTVP